MTRANEFFFSLSYPFRNSCILDLVCSLREVRLPELRRGVKRKYFPKYIVHRTFLVSLSLVKSRKNSYNRCNAESKFLSPAVIPENRYILEGTRTCMRNSCDRDPKCLRKYCARAFQNFSLSLSLSLSLFFIKR